MNKLLLAAPLALAVAAGTAQAQTLVATSNIVVRALDRSINFTSDVTSRISDMKVVVEAREDAASFVASAGEIRGAHLEARSEEHTSELQSLMRISYAAFCLKHTT